MSQMYRQEPWEQRCWECGVSTQVWRYGDPMTGRFEFRPPMEEFNAQHVACQLPDDQKWCCADHSRAFPKGTNCPECEAAGFVCEAMGGDGVPRRFPNRSEFELAAWKREQIECQPEGDYLRVACCDCGSKRHKLTRYTRHGMDKTGINWTRCGECDKALRLRWVKP